MDDQAREPDKPITRRDLPAVVRRAAELSALDEDTNEQLPEEEVIRIAAELGLAERHVRQALYEGVKDEPQPGFLDRQLGKPRIMAARAVPFDEARVRRVLEDYFVTHEYMQVVRRQANATTFEPASDAISRFARGFQRSSKHQLAAALTVEISVRSLEAGWSHVRIRALFKDERTRKIVGSSVAGALVGLPLGGVAAFMISSITHDAFGLGASTALAVTSGIATFFAVAGGMLASLYRRYRGWRARTQTEAESILDRVERGEDLRPPPPPWIRKLQARFGRW